MYSVATEILAEEEVVEITVQDDYNGSIIDKLKIPMIHGVPYSRFCSAPRWRQIDGKVKYRAGDVIVASYPKCGTTWSEQCLLLLLNNGDASQLDPRSKNTYSPTTGKGKIWFEAMLEQDPELVNSNGLEFVSMSVEEMEAVPSRRVIKTHAVPNLLLGTNRRGIGGLPAGVKVVIVVRNPLDACVSCYYHPPQHNPAAKGWPFAAWAATWLDGWSPSGSYFDWVRSWHEQVQSQPSDNPSAIFVLYEVMKANSHAEVRRIADFVGVTYDDELIDRVVRLSSFESMVAQTEESGGDSMKHLRKGKVGDWRNHFTPEMALMVRERTMRDLPAELATEIMKYIDA